ncbi:MAG: diaminopimelate epimerase, partial [Pseudomonadota bacterium]
NAARCVAALLLDETGGSEVAIGSKGGPMRAWRAARGGISIDMGEPRFSAADIPLADLTADPLSLRLPPFSNRFGPAACANVGNPHAVFFTDDVDTVPLMEVGPQLERHEAFPERANISFVSLKDGVAKTRVFERGVGPTRACGTAACAIGALTHHLGMTGPQVTVELPGGPLDIEIKAGRIIMTGPYQLDYVGAITRDGFVRDPLPAV